MFVCYFGLPKLYNNNKTVTLCWIKLTILGKVHYDKGGGMKIETRSLKF